MDRPSALNSDGLPFVFDAMVLERHLKGTLQEVNDRLLAGQAPETDRSGSGPRTHQVPLSLDIVEFP